MTTPNQLSLLPEQEPAPSEPTDVNEVRDSYAAGIASHIDAVDKDSRREETTRRLRYAGFTGDEIKAHFEAEDETVASAEGPRLENPLEQAAMDAQLRGGQIATGAAFESEHLAQTAHERQLIDDTQRK